MSSSDWALNQLSNLLPLDHESLKQILDYTSTLPNDDAAQHLQALLGDSPRAFEFISAYNARRASAATSSASIARFNQPQDQIDEVPKSTRKAAQKHKAPLHQLPSRQIQGHGDVSGAYQKGRGDERALASKQAQAGSSSASNITFALSETPAAEQLPKKSTGPRKLPPSAAGNLISDLPNVKQKSLSKSNSRDSSRTSSPAPKTKVTITGGVPGKGASSTLEDLDAAIRSLEIQNNPSLSSKSSTTGSRACNCNAQRHPLLTAAPNCLKCGKIICLKEGIGPCTFCQSPLLSHTEISEMLNSLKQERGLVKQAAHNSAHSRSVVSSKGSSISNTGLDKAVAHRNKLLDMQANNAQRTIVHDEAADMADPVHGVNRWADPVERARQLKLQQKAMQDQEEREKPEWERKGMVLNIELGKGAKVRREVTMGQRMKDQSPNSNPGSGPGPGSGQEAENTMAASGGAEQSDLSLGQAHGYARNPLLASSGLIRPMWEGGKGSYPGTAEGAGKEGPGQEVRGWKRMEENEDIILNGGAYGRDRRLGTEERAMG